MDEPADAPSPQARLRPTDPPAALWHQYRHVLFRLHLSDVRLQRVGVDMARRLHGARAGAGVLGEHIRRRDEGKEVADSVKLGRRLSVPRRPRPNLPGREADERLSVRRRPAVHVPGRRRLGRRDEVLRGLRHGPRLWLLRGEVPSGRRNGRRRRRSYQAGRVRRGLGHGNLREPVGELLHRGDGGVPASLWRWDGRDALDCELGDISFAV
mmetsp:Transcript_23869/g.47495  ORF Transcript_23869/g.47495 Transcript_23869/m.47495 type:complete len:211 (+) Transcript_23869:1183-1815(+)